ncbi:subunit Rpb1 of DNA-directed RNA polymerase, partial [Hamiltosporidium magnivora]
KDKNNKTTTNTKKNNQPKNKNNHPNTNTMNIRFYCISNLETSFVGRIINLSFDLNFNKNIILFPILEDTLNKVIVRCVEGLRNPICDKNILNINGNDLYSLCSVVNINKNIKNYKNFLDIEKSYCNDVYGMYKILGVEGCRSVLVREIESVFDVYGIGVDKRHLGLISDYLLVDGVYSSFSRFGMEKSESILLKMSFESCYSVLRDASHRELGDCLEGPSGCLTAGLPVRNGTGCFELLYDMEE